MGLCKGSILQSEIILLYPKIVDRKIIDRLKKINKKLPEGNEPSALKQR